MIKMQLKAGNFSHERFDELADVQVAKVNI